MKTMRGSGLLYATDLIGQTATSEHLLLEQGSVSRADGIMPANERHERVGFWVALTTSGDETH